MTDSSAIDIERTPVDDEADTTERNARILALFDAAALVHCGVSVWESRLQGCAELLKLWALERGEEVVTKAIRSEKYPTYDLHRVVFAGGHEIIVYGKDRP